MDIEKANRYRVGSMVADKHNSEFTDYLKTFLIKIIRCVSFVFLSKG